MTPPTKALKQRVVTKLGRKAGVDSLAMPTLRQAQRLLARDRILEAAAIEFAERGYGNTTIDDIVRRAGLSRATVYLHFKNRQDIVAAFANENIDEFRELFSSVPLHKGAGPGEIEGWIDRLFAFYDRRRNRIIVYRQAQVADSDVDRMVEQNYLSIIRAVWPKVSGGRRWNGSEKALRQVKRLRFYIGLTDSACFMAVVAGVVPAALARDELTALWLNFPAE
jgi:AcrR family transcriptional regulator